VIRIRRSIVVGQMTPAANCRQSGELTVLVAIDAHHRTMRTRQWKRGYRMIEVRRLPGGGRVASFACQRKSRRRMIRIDGTRVLQLVTGNALR
jgi:hypothetical protein